MLLLFWEFLSHEGVGIHSLSSSTVLLLEAIILEMFAFLTSYCSWAVKGVLAFSYLKYPDC